MFYPVPAKGIYIDDGGRNLQQNLESHPSLCLIRGPHTFIMPSAIAGHATNDGGRNFRIMILAHAKDGRKKT